MIKEGKNNMKKLFSIAVALSMITTAGLIATISTTPINVNAGVQPPEEENATSLRVYGYINHGAGDHNAQDPWNGLYPENFPYTDPIAPFDPQNSQAPIKDFVTFNPVYMDHFDPDWDNDGADDWVYLHNIKVNNTDAIEKEFFRMYYVPVEFDKDENQNGELDVIYECTDPNSPDYGDVKTWVSINNFHYRGELEMKGYEMRAWNNDSVKGDIYAPSIVQEFTFMFLDTAYMPTLAPPGTSRYLIPMASSEVDNGIDSFDANGDGEPDPVWVCSEANLGDLDGDLAPECLDIDNDNVSQPIGTATGPLDYQGHRTENLDEDGVTLSGDESVVLRLTPMTIGEGESIQFFDHEIRLAEVTGNILESQATFDLYYKGNPDSRGDEKVGSFTLTVGQSTRYGRSGTQLIGPGFTWVVSINYDQKTAKIVVGRLFGEAYANIGANTYWNQKQFYVDGVKYDTLAVMTEDMGNSSLFKYITFKSVLPKVKLFIPNHSQYLIGWKPGDTLPVMPQFNMGHAIREDIEEGWGWLELLKEEMYAANNPSDWTEVLPLDNLEKIGPVADDIPALILQYIKEEVEPRYTGQLKEILDEPDRDNHWTPWDNYCEEQGPDNLYDCEDWWLYAFKTIPDHFTEFILPEGHGLYLMTTAYTSDESGRSVWYDGEWDKDEGPVPYTGWTNFAGDLNNPLLRMVFWYNATNGNGIWINDYDNYNTLKVYGYINHGAGDHNAQDPWNGLYPENFPYTDPIAPFDPQNSQAPIKDFVTFNPVYMDHFDPDWDNDGADDWVYLHNIKVNNTDAIEKEFFRMYYVPVEFDKDENQNGELDVIYECTDPNSPDYGDVKTWVSINNFHYRGELEMKGYEMRAWNNDSVKGDIYAPSIVQEFTFMFLDTAYMPTLAPPGTSRYLIPMASSEVDNGIDSFDANGDGEPDPVWVCSEANLGDLDGDLAPECLDIDNDNVSQPIGTATGPLDYQGHRTENLDEDGVTLSGDESVVLRLTPMTIGEGESIQFFDHEIRLAEVTGNILESQATFDLYYKGNPDSRGDEKVGSFTLTVGQSTRYGRSGTQLIGPGFTWVVSINYDQKTAKIVVGRLFGEAYANIGANTYWNQKQFYVDGVKYDTLAVMTEDMGNSSLFKYITFKSVLPKVKLFIPNHSQYLIGWKPGDTLPVMPQFNMGHAIREDIEEGWGWLELLKEEMYAANNPSDWTEVLPLDNLEKIGPVADDIPALILQYIKEEVEPRYTGQLKEILDEPDRDNHWTPWDNYCEEQGPDNLYDCEDWWLYAFKTIPDHFTEFILPEGHGLYLMTTAYTSDESGRSVWYDGEWDKDEGPVPYPPLTYFAGDENCPLRMVFWYDAINGDDLYVNGAAAVSSDWNPWDDDGVITTQELQEAINCWVNDIPKNGHLVTTGELQELISGWLSS